jgi:drug/metabolite transporter (DMT)-like permease
MINKYLLLLIFSVFIASISQILLKISADRKHNSKIREYFNSYVIIAYSIFCVSLMLTILALRGLELKNVPIIESTSYIYILILSRIFLKEKITKYKIGGSFLIILGIIVFNLF